MKVSSVNQMRLLDKTAIERYAIPPAILMENAGEASYFVILQAYGVQDKRFVVFCGSGHNGGDGLVVARKLHSSGGRVQVLCLGSVEKFDETVRFHYQMVERAGIPFSQILDDDLTLARQALAQADVVVDAIFGTGLSREVGGRYRAAVELINQSKRPVVAIDIPSGVHGDTGQVMGVAVRAEHTITFGLPKTGSLLFPGFELGGKLHVTHISFPPENTNRDEIMVETSRLAPLPPRQANAHKGSCGKVLFVAGAARYLGAPTFSAMSFLRAGGGLSYLATPRGVAPFIASKGNEIVLLPQAETPSGSLALSNLDALLETAASVDMVVVGPGVSLDEETQTLVRELAARIDKPLLIDGDGLSAVAAHPGSVRQRTAPTVLTPHPGEMARLLDVSLGAVMADRIGILQRGVQEWQAHIALKGAHTLIGEPDGRVSFNLSGNAGMATAGSGDVLTGTIAAMLAASHFDFGDAVRMGVFLHGLAGDLAADEVGEDGMVAGDILAHLPAALRHYRQHYSDIVRTFYDKIDVI
jgi:NAD(P)H-hydrate epimerase